MKTPRRHQRGAMLFVALLFCVMISSLMVYLLSLAYQRTRLVDMVGIKRTRNYYRAQAGIVDAFWRLRTNHAPPGYVGTVFNDPTSTVQYYLDIEAGTVTAAVAASSTTKVSIGAKNQTAGSPLFGLRPVTATGIDN